MKFLYLLGVLAAIGLLFLFARVVRGRSDEARIERTITLVATSKNPAVCDEKMTPAYLEQLNGVDASVADELCEIDVADSRVRSVEIEDVRVDGDVATALVTDEGGSYDGSRVEVRLVRSDGGWRLDRLLAFTDFDRSGFDRAYRRSFLEYGSPPSSADCALGRSRRLSDAEIEATVLSGGVGRVFTPIFVACDRDGAERGVVAAISTPEYELPAAAIGCAARRVEVLSDAELSQLLNDPVIYGALAWECGRDAILDHTAEVLREDGFGPSAVDCVLRALHRRSPAAAARLGYDDDRYEALIDRCRGQAEIGTKPGWSATRSSQARIAG